MKLVDVAHAFGLSFALAALAGALLFLLFLADGFSFAIMFGGQTEYLQPFNEANQIVAGFEIACTIFAIGIMLAELVQVVERLKR